MMRSLRTRLSVLTLACIALVVLPFFALTYSKIIEEVDELSDARLAQNARTIEVLAEHASLADPALEAPLEIENWHRSGSSKERSERGHPYETEVGFQYWKNPSDLQLVTQDLRSLAFDAAPPGFADIRKDGKRWRVFTLATRNNGFVRAAERYDSRREIARDLLLQNSAPLLLGLPLLAVLVGWAVRRGLKPIVTIAQRLEARAPDAIGPVSTRDAPKEIEPLLGALNGLLRRLRAVLENERQFTANAAHELRTPLAGALVHIENAQAAVGPDDRANALGEARRGLERMTHIVNQMLDLARWDAAAAARDFGPVDLGRCVDEELAALGLAAVDKDIEIVRAIDESARIVNGWEPGLRTLLRNLLDNAIRYGFAHGRIDIGIASRAGRTLLTISDSGPGIVASRRAAMLERFQRGSEAAGEGSGLGLSIVARIADLHGASVSLLDPDDRQGLRVEVLFPAAGTRRHVPTES
ncbi:ATP-binding protein [Dokdonella soli]|uniref:histidine kinase n=1 Tax=Dokdonella soli TaxID=529810 RepID=A0ABN1IYS2_9GAMM